MLRERTELKDRFDVIRELGEGTATTVYLVKDRERNNALRALKILVNKTAFDAHTGRRFADELAICQTFTHPNLVKAYDHIDLGYTTAFTMEYVEGEDLAHLLRRGKPSYEEIEKIFLQVLDALENLHQQGICHRDLKLENILRRNDGVIKVSDLGLMKREDGKDLTQTGVLLGTANYMPPEYIQRNIYDVRGDIWAVGLMIYELSTGKRRISDKHGLEAIQHLIATGFQLPSMSLAGLPKKFLYVISRALEIKPEKRFQTVAEMRAALTMSDEQVQALFAPTMEVPVQPSIDLSTLGAPAGTPRAAKPIRGVGTFGSNIPAPRSNLLWVSTVLALIVVMGIPAYVISKQPPPPIPRAIPEGTYLGTIKDGQKIFAAKAKLTQRAGDTTLDLGVKGCPTVLISAADNVIPCLSGDYAIELNLDQNGHLAGTVENLTHGNNYRIDLTPQKAAPRPSR